MEQFNKELPVNQEAMKPAVVPFPEGRMESPLLTKVRHNFAVFGGISLIFGVCFTILFYKAGIGINTLLFTLIIIALMVVIMKKLSLPIKTGTKFYYAGAALLALSSTLTASEILLFLNVIGILLLLDLSLLHQFYEDQQWDFMKHCLRMLGLPFQCIITSVMPFIDCIQYMKHTKVFKNDKARNVFLGMILSLPFLWLVIALLASADLLFGKMTNNLFNLIFSADIFAVIIMVFLGFIICYCVICAALSKAGLKEKEARGKADASIAITFMTILSLVYLLFSGIQVFYLFAKGLFVLPDGFTYAEYARRGFFELLAVAILNVSLILICRALFQESRLLRLIITGMTICTYIMIVSATYRMLLYIGAYYLTFLRVFVLLSLLIIALILAGVIISEYKKSFPLFLYSVAVVTILYIAFSFSKPDYYIAGYLIDNKNNLDLEDMAYMTYDLSLDAAPLVITLLADDREWNADGTAENDNYDIRDYDDGYESIQNLVNEYNRKIDNSRINQDIRDFNYSRYLAYQALYKNPL